MTLQEAENQLYQFLLTNDIFNVNKDWSYIGFADTNDKEHEIKDIAVLAAKKYVAAGVLEQLNERGIYILTKPLAHYTNPIEVYPVCAAEIARLVNKVDVERNVDPKNLTNQDLESLILLIRELLKERE